MTIANTFREDLELVLWNLPSAEQHQARGSELLVYLLARLSDFLATKFEVLDMVANETACSIVIREPHQEAGILTVRYAGGLSIINRNGKIGVYGVLFPFIMGHRVAPSAYLSHLVIDYEARPGASPQWQPPVWVEDTFGEYDGYTFQFYYGRDWPFPDIAMSIGG